MIIIKDLDTGFWKDIDNLDIYWKNWIETIGNLATPSQFK